MGLVDGGRGRVGGSDVSDDRVTAHLARHARRSVGVDINDCDPGAGAREEQGEETAAAVPAADDQRRLVLESEEVVHDRVGPKRRATFAPRMLALSSSEIGAAWICA